MGISCVAAVDLGTTAVKVCLFTERLFLLAESVHEYKLLTPEPGFAEAPASLYLNAVKDGISDVLRKAPEAEISGISLSSQGETFTVSDRGGDPVIPFIVWLDTRASVQAERVRERIPDDVFYSVTGLPEPDGALPLSKLMWLADVHPETISEHNRILLLEDFIIYMLCGRIVSEKSLQTSSGWFSLRDDDYWDDALEAAGIPRRMLPELAEPGDIAGYVTAEAARFFGLREGIPVIAGAMDQTAAALAAGCTRKGVISESTGTALAVTAFTDRPPDPRGPRLTVYRHIRKHDYLLIGIGRTGGRCLTWLRELFFPGLDYDRLVGMAASAPAGSGGPVFLPFLTGGGSDDPADDLKGCFLGLTLSTSPGQIVRSVLEGVCCELACLLGDVESLSSPCGRVISMGGGAKSPFLEQLKADICQKTFSVPLTENAAAAGAAMLALGALTPGSVPEALGLAASYSPIPENRAAAAECLGRYLKTRARVTRQDRAHA